MLDFQEDFSYSKEAILVGYDENDEFVYFADAILLKVGASAMEITRLTLDLLRFFSEEEQDDSRLLNIVRIAEKEFPEEDEGDVIHSAFIAIQEKLLDGEASEVPGLNHSSHVIGRIKGITSLGRAYVKWANEHYDETVLALKDSVENFSTKVMIDAMSDFINRSRKDE